MKTIFVKAGATNVDDFCQIKDIERGNSFDPSFYEFCSCDYLEALPVIINEKKIYLLFDENGKIKNYPYPCVVLYSVQGVLDMVEGNAIIIPNDEEELSDEDIEILKSQILPVKITETETCCVLKIKV